MGIERNDAGIRRHQSGQYIEEGRLSRAVGSQQPDNLAALNIDADVKQHRPVMVMLGDVESGQARCFTDDRQIIGCFNRIVGGGVHGAAFAAAGSAPGEARISACPRPEPVLRSLLTPVLKLASTLSPFSWLPPLVMFTSPVSIAVSGPG